jgi:hypothetical protein
MADDTEAPASPADERRRSRLAAIEAELEHGRQMAERYGREQPRERFAVLGHSASKGRRRVSR